MVYSQNKAQNETVILNQRKKFFRNPLEIELKTYYISRNLKTNVEQTTEDFRFCSVDIWLAGGHKVVSNRFPVFVTSFVCISLRSKPPPHKNVDPQQGDTLQKVE